MTEKLLTRTLNLNTTKTKSTNLYLQNWDEELAMVAQAWADTCVFGHDNNYERIIPGNALIC